MDTITQHSGKSAARYLSKAANVFFGIVQTRLYIGSIKYHTVAFCAFTAKAESVLRGRPITALLLALRVCFILRDVSARIYTLFQQASTFDL